MNKSKLGIVGVLAMLFILCTGCIKQTPQPILDLSAEEITGINVSTAYITQREQIEKVLNYINSGILTGKKSIDDTPKAESYKKIEIITQEETRSLYYYEEKGKYYIEAPYEGIYQVKQPIEEILSN